MNRRLRIGVAMLALCGVGYAGARYARRNVASEAVLSRVTGPASTNDAEVVALRAEVHQLKALLQLAYVAAATNKTCDKGTESQADDDPVAPELTLEQEKAWLTARSKLLDGALTNEPRDEKWAGAIEAKAATIGKSLKDKGVVLVDARCWSDHCRMEYSFRDGDTRTEHLPSLGEAFEELPEVSYAYPGEPPQARAILYMSKSGAPLPELDGARDMVESHQASR